MGCEVVIPHHMSADEALDSFPEFLGQKHAKAEQ